MKPVIVDTSCIVALLDKSERRHKRCSELVTTLAGPLITCEAVLAESCYLLRFDTRAVDAVLANVEAGIFQVPFDITQSCPRVRQLLHKYKSVPMDFADACLVHLAEEFETPRILTLDDDFSVYRWAGKRIFENLIQELSV